MINLSKPKRLIQLVCLLLFISSAASAQINNITGKIADADNKPVAGAAVLIKGSSRGVISADDGSFHISAHKNDVLVVSHVGYEPKEVSVQPGQDYTIILVAAENSLNAVVVTGYETQKKIDLTGAVASISGKELQNRPITNITQALQGQIANLNITQSTGGGAPNAVQNINVRGYTGLGQTGSPLIVIDGIPYGDINAVNPNDIESITVLKDAAASAIYGSSAPYGVMLITTKQGKRNGRPSISYNNNFSFSQPINLPVMADALTWANVFNEAFVNAGRVPWFDDETIQRIKDHMSGTLPDETIRDPRPGVDDWYGSGVGYNSGRGPNYGNGNNDWFKVFFKRWSFSQQHNIDLSGGGNATTYYLGAGYMGKEGMYNFADDDYKRYNLRANISTDPARWLKLNFRSAFSRGKNNTPAAYSSLTGGNWMHQIARKLPNTPLKNPDGYYSDYSNVNNFTEGGRDLSTDDQLTLTGETIITPLKGWNITANYTLNGEYYYDEIFNKTVYTYLPSGTKVVEWQTDPNNSLAKSQVNINHTTINLFSSYETNLGDHYFKILGGYIRDYTDYKEFSASNSLLYSNDIPSLNLTYNTTPAVGDIMRRLAIEGFFGRFNYNYRDKYLVELNGRYDASSRFLQGRRWQLYPSVSAGYNISKENFWQPLEKYVNALKIRGSYGTLGDQWGDDPGHTNFYPFYPSLGTVSPSGTNWIFANGREAYIGPPGLVNPNLTWARIKTFDLGADIYFLNNRLSASFDWYKRRTDDFVGPGQALPVVLGAAVPIENNASIETKGFELTLGWSDKIGNVAYYVKGVLSNYKGKVLQYPNPTQLLTTWYPGMTMGEIWGYVTQGLFKSNQEVADAPDQSKLYGAQWTPGDVRYKDLDGNNLIDYGDYTAKHPGDLKVIGNNTPQYSYGLSLGAQYRGFDLSVFLQGVAKRDVWISSNMFWGIVPGGAPEWQSSVFTKTLNYWSADNPNGYFPKIYMSDQMSKNEQVQTRYLQNAAYMRVKNLQIGYALPQGLIRKAHLQQLRLYLSIDNLATITKLQNTLDPELSIPALEGDGKIYPLQRTFSFGLNIGL